MEFDTLILHVGVVEVLLGIPTSTRMALSEVGGPESPHLAHVRQDVVVPSFPEPSLQAKLQEEVARCQQHLGGRPVAQSAWPHCALCFCVARESHLTS